MNDPNSFDIYCEHRELTGKWRNLSSMHQAKLLPGIVTGIGASERGQPKLVIYFSANSDEESREVAMGQIVGYLA